MLYPRAIHHILPVIDGVPLNHHIGGNTPRLAIWHIMQGTLDGTDGWFHNPKSQVSAHFGIGKDGTVIQWVDTKDQAWHAVAANDHSIGVENEGFSGHPLTNDQINAGRELFDWILKNHHDVDNWLNKRPDTGSGLSWHGLGGLEWGGHLDCPGAPIVHQLDELLTPHTYNTKKKTG